MMEIILEFYNYAKKRISQNTNVEELSHLPIREKIGRFKYVPEENAEKEYKKILNELR